MTKTQAKRQIHGMRLIANKVTIARAILDARKYGDSSWTALRNRTSEDYDLLISTLNESR
jgi:hypothetical protein